MDDHTGARYEDDDLLVMSDIAVLWGVEPKSIRSYRWDSTHDHPERFPPPDVMLPHKPLWKYSTIRDFKRPSRGM